MSIIVRLIYCILCAAACCWLVFAAAVVSVAGVGWLASYAIPVDLWPLVVLSLITMAPASRLMVECGARGLGK